jgi:hypothetical protein
MGALLPGAAAAGIPGGNITPSALPHLAGGTDYAGGGWSLVGENGPELVNLPTGARVISNASLQNLGMGAPSGSGTSIVFDNRGAVIWEQAARQMMAYADRAAANAGISAAQFSRSSVPNDLARAASRRLA